MNSSIQNLELKQFSAWSSNQNTASVKHKGKTNLGQLERVNNDTVIQRCSSSVTIPPSSSVTIPPSSSVTIRPSSSVTIRPSSSVTIRPSSSVTIPPFSSVTIPPFSSITTV
ncbi:WSC domain-containing protein [Elysia marginata]|uniref:WSC domain-containing protein n=1 Tax=Elysia marginata TaxID=1093978 RepID=A0AAV4HS19_9GAST|nr:WSC domain-containing protein [Elysia marginata]